MNELNEIVKQCYNNIEEIKIGVHNRNLTITLKNKDVIHVTGKDSVKFIYQRLIK